MKARTPFWPLLHNGLGLNLFGPLPLIAWLLCSLAIVFFMVSPNFPVTFIREHASDSRVGEGVIACSFLVFIWQWLAFSGILTHLANSGATRNIMEFMWTRAIDRRVAHRAGAATTWIIFLGPLFLNLLLSPLAPDLAFEPEDVGPPEAARMMARYHEVFPGSHYEPETRTEPARTVIRHGRAFFAAWMCWVGVVCFIGMGVYWSLVLTQIQRHAWRLSERWKFRRVMVDLVVSAPLFAVPLVPVVFALIWRIDLYEESFLFFSAHWIWVVLVTAAMLIGAQRFSERKFSELELP